MKKPVKLFVIVLLFALVTPMAVFFCYGMLPDLEVFAEDLEQITELPLPPSNLLVVSKTDTSVELSWIVAADASLVTAYEIYEGETKLDETQESFYRVEGLSPNKEYSFSVRARDAAGNLSEPSDVLIVITDEKPIGEKEPVAEELPGAKLPENQPDNTKLFQGSGSGLLGRYYISSDFSGLAFMNTDSQVDFNWGNGSPDGLPDKKHYSVRWTGQIEPMITGEHTFYAYSGGGVRLWLDGQLLIDGGRPGHPEEYTGVIVLETGRKYDIKIEYYPINSKSLISLYWSCGNLGKQLVPQSQLYPEQPPAAIPDGNGSGLKGEYYNDENLTELVAERIDPEVIFNWGNDSPAAGVNSKKYSVRWVGKIEPRYTGEYILYVKANDGIRLWVEDRLLINQWHTGNMQENSAKIGLAAEQKYDIKIEYLKHKGNSSVSLSWSSDDQVKQVIPSTQLYPVGLVGFTELQTRETEIILSWESSTQATGYDIEADGDVTENIQGAEYTHTGLLPGTLHTYRVRARNGSVADKWSEELPVWTLPPAVGDIDSFATQTQIAISWGVVQGADTYDVEFDGILIEDQLLSYTQDNLMPGTEHKFRVRARNSSGAGVWSGEYTKWTVPGTIESIEKKATETDISISWDNVTGATGYDIEVDGQLFEHQESPYTHTGLDTGTRHLYRIRAKNSSGDGAWSENLEVWTLPGEVKGIDMQASQNEIFVQWEPVQGADVYDIEIDGTVVERVSNPYISEALVPGTLHTCRVRARNSSGTGIWSEKMSKWTLPDIVNNSSSEATESSISLQWREVAGADGYDIEVDGILIENVASPYEHNELKEGTRHSYKLRAKNSSGVGLWSDVIVKWTLPGIPAGMKLQAGETYLTASWEEVKGATAYDTEIDGVLEENVSNPWTKSGLLPGKEYTCRVRAKNDSGNGKWSEEFRVWTIPDIVKNIVATAAQTWIEAAWIPVTGATGYDVEVDETVVAEASSPYLLEKLQPGTEHIFRVRAKNSSGEGRWSEAFSKWTIPAIPQNLNAESTSNSITIGWIPVTGATGYDAEVYGTVVDTGGINSYTHFGLDANTQHTYRVRAKNSSGEGEWSDIIAETTLPGIPLNINTNAEDKTISVAWEAVPGAVTYDIEVDGEHIKGLEQTAYIHTGLDPNTRHTYRVRSVNNDGASEWSRIINCATLLAEPGSIHALADSTEITVTWDDVPGAVGYDIEADGAVKNSDMGTSYVHTGLSPDTGHTYRVRARSLEGTGMWSKEISQFTLLASPENITAESSGTWIIVKWDMVAGAIAYDVETDGIVVENGLSTVFELESLEPLSNHTFRVRAWSKAGAGEWSEIISRTTLIGTPSNIVTTSSSTDIKIQWDNVSGATGYDVMMDGETLDVGTVNSHIHTGLVPNSIHVYKVRAKTNNIPGEWSKAITAGTVVGVPVNIASLVSSREIRIAWDQVDGASMYDIEINGVIIEVGTDNCFIHTGLTPNTLYKYRVRAGNENGSSDWNDYTECTTSPDIPTNFRTKATTTEITVAWDIVDGATTYDLEIDGVIISDIKDKMYVHTRLKSNSRHVYKIRSRNVFSSSNWSQELVQATTPEIDVPVKKDTAFNFVIVIPQKTGAKERTIIVTYNPDELEVFDLCAVTPSPETEAGNIEGTDITVTEFVPGRIVYKIDNADGTIVNIIKFLSKTTGHSNVTYTIE